MLMCFYTCMQVLAFFFCGLWMVPFAFFISLSANDLVLPTLAGQHPGILSGARTYSVADTCMFLYMLCFYLCAFIQIVELPGSLFGRSKH